MYSGQSLQPDMAGQTYDSVHFNMYYPIQQPFAYNVNYGGSTYYVHPSHVTCDNNTVNNATSIDRVRTRQNDEKAIEQFLQEAERVVPTKSRQKDHGSKIMVAKNALISVIRLNKQLEAVCTELRSNINLPEAQWQEKVNACNAAKHEICEILKPIKDTDFLNKVKNDLEKRKKKRTRQQLRKKEWKKEKLIKEERRVRLHAEADAWIRKEKAVIEREKQEENLRKDADMILSDVRSKRNDARKYLGILQELQNLRRIKTNIGRARGEKLSSAAEKAFNDTIAKLTEQWATLDRDYATEEQELKLTLKTDNEKRIEKQTKNFFNDWENVLFGTTILATEHSYKDVDGFIMTRAAWDKFISSENDATTIPIGWIVPEKPSSAAWQKCLNKETS